MKSDKRTSSGNSNVAEGSPSLMRACGMLGLFLCGSELAAQQFPDRSLYVPPPGKNTTPKPVETPRPVEPPKPGETPSTPTQPALAEPSPAVTSVETLPGAAVVPMGRRRPHEVSASGDFFWGQGDVTLPIGYSLNKTIGGADIPQEGATADRESTTYFGGTVSYSYKQGWSVDLSYAQGSSTANVSIDTKGLGDLATRFEIEDQYYQFYLRYAFPGLRGKRFSAYLRAGVTYGEAELTADATSPFAGVYHQEDETKDILGNLGFGLGYSLLATEHFRLGLQMEGEGFFGYREQDTLETLSETDLTFKGAFKPATIDNTLYGGIGRGTLRAQYQFGESGALKIFAEGGAQMKYTIVDYTDSDQSAPNELLWGPYVKVGLRYSF